MARPRTSAFIFLAFATLYFIAFVGKGAIVDPPPLPKGTASTAFDANRAVARLARILGDQRPHPVDSDANDAVRARLLAEIRALGYAPEVRDDFSCVGRPRWSAMGCARVRNVLFRTGPAGADAILVASHYDSVAAGPGAGDDGVGVATALEIAGLLKGRALKRPVVFLFTDGEEAGLFGAASFVRNDPYAKDIAAIVNLEARGVAGKALMFETAAPNGRSIAAYARVAAPASNSLATAIYKMMPNDTDMTEFLALDADALNFAITRRVAYYHTPHDNLANLDRRSVAHMGASALRSIEGFDAQKGAPVRADVAFTDFLGRVLIVFPQIAGWVALGAGAALALVVFARVGGGGAFAAFAAPVVGLGLGGAFAFGALQLAALLRPGETYWSAWPVATRAALYAGAVFGVVIALRFLARRARVERLVAAAWFWFAVLGLAASFIAPGALGVVAPPVAVFAAAALMALAAPGLFPALAIAAALAAFLFVTPLIALAEDNLGLGAAAPFAAFAALLTMLGLPLARPNDDAPNLAPGFAGAAFFAAVVALLIAPAYTPSAPRPANIVHHLDGASGKAWWTSSVRPAWSAPAGAFVRTTPPGLVSAVYAAPARAHDARPVSAERISETADASGRRIRVRIVANGADVVTVSIPEAAGVSALAAGGVEIAFDKRGARTFRCTGRACAEFIIEARVAPSRSAWSFYGFRYGLDEAGAPLRAQRPASDTPIQLGDGRRVWSEATL